MKIMLLTQNRTDLWYCHIIMSTDWKNIFWLWKVKPVSPACCVMHTRVVQMSCKWLAWNGGTPLSWWSADTRVQFYDGPVSERRVLLFRLLKACSAGCSTAAVWRTAHTASHVSWQLSRMSRRHSTTAALRVNIGNKLSVTFSYFISYFSSHCGCSVGIAGEITIRYLQWRILCLEF